MGDGMAFTTSLMLLQMASWIGVRRTISCENKNKIPEEIKVKNKVTMVLTLQAASRRARAHFVDPTLMAL